MKEIFAAGVTFDQSVDGVALAAAPPDVTLGPEQAARAIVPSPSPVKLRK
ncbi:MAG: hypothetical protein ACYCZY_03020 [Lacisediminihabitans sp.]